MIKTYFRAVYLTEGLDQVFIKNYQNDQFIFGQYFGSTSGLLRYYPAFFWDTANEVNSAQKAHLANEVGPG